METKEFATEINEANIGKVVQYHDNGWRLGTLDGLTEDSIRVKKITGGNVKFMKRDDVRLVIREAEKPKATPATAEEPAKVAKPKAQKAARKPAKKSGKPGKKAKRYDVNFSVKRAVALYDRGKGKTVSEIAQAMGYPKNRGQNRVANALIAAGVYKGKRAS